MKRMAVTILGLLTLTVAVGEAITRYGLGVEPSPLPPDDTLDEPLGKFVEFDPVLGVRYKPNVDVLIDAPSGDFSILFKTNEIGLRDRPMGTHLRKELKFLFLGDEFVEGWGTDIDENAIVEAQRTVNARTALQPPVRFVIGGKSGYGAAQNLLIARQLVEQMPVRGIVFVYSALMPHSDRRFLARANIEDGIAVGLHPVRGSGIDWPHAEDHPRSDANPFAGLASKSALARWLADRWTAFAVGRAQPAGDALRDRLAGMRGDATQLEASLAPTLTHVKAIAALAGERDIPFMLVYLPLAPQVAGDEWPTGRARFGLPAARIDSPDGALIEAFCRAENLRCLTAVAPLRAAAEAPDGLPLWHASEFGLTADGNRVLGAWLADAVFDWMGQLGMR